MRELFKLNIIKDERGYLHLLRADVKGLQAEARAKYSKDGLRTLKANIDERTTAMMQLNAISMGNRIVTYYDVLEALKCFDIPEFEGVVLTEDFILDLQEEVNIRCNCFSSLVNPTVETLFVETYNEEVTEARKAKLYDDLDKIIGIPQKIRFLQKEKLNYLKNLSGRTLEASGNAIAGGFPNGPNMFDRFIDIVIEELKLELKSPQPTIDGLIKPELINRLCAVEIKLSVKIEDWKQGNKKIECAAFCELLHDFGYFIDKKNNRKGPMQFALIRYGVEIEVQMGTTKKDDRKVHKGMLHSYFK